MGEARRLDSDIQSPNIITSELPQSCSCHNFHKVCSTSQNDRFLNAQEGIGAVLVRLWKFRTLLLHTRLVSLLVKAFRFKTSIWQEYYYFSRRLGLFNHEAETGDTKSQDRLSGFCMDEDPINVAFSRPLRLPAVNSTVLNWFALSVLRCLGSIKRQRLCMRYHVNRRLIFINGIDCDAYNFRFIIEIPVSGASGLKDD